MIIFRIWNMQITIPKNEYAIYLQDGKYPNGDECETLVIQTPSKKYLIVGIDGGMTKGYEVVENILDFIKNNIEKDIIYIDIDEVCGHIYAMETIVVFLEVSDN